MSEKTFDRNQLVHAVIWPNAKDAAIALYDTVGVEVSRVKIDHPKKGADISRMMPQEYLLGVVGCTVVSLSGKPVVSTKAPFDTSVVTERPEVTFEERLARMERTELRRRKREAQREAEMEAAVEELAALRAERAAAGISDEPVVEPEPETTETPVAATEPVKEPSTETPADET